MRKIKEILRQKWENGLTKRQIARACSVSHSTINELLRRADKAGISWPVPEELDDATLEKMLYPPPLPAAHARTALDMEMIHQELRRKGVTLQLLWEEYKEKHPNGYQYSQFCELYRQWCKTLDITLRQTHKAGEKLFVDYAGQTVQVIDKSTGEIQQAQIFVAVLGATNYTYAEATWQQDLASWIASHCRALEYFGGVPKIIVPDNLAAGVSHSDRYEPDVNPTYNDMAVHYGVAVIPARPRKPRDKAKGEKGVQLISQQILARLRNRMFFSLPELNAAIREALDTLNNKPFQKLEGSRLSMFMTMDKPALRPLPSQRYEFAEWKKARVNIDCHVEVTFNFYSAPYQLVKEQVDVRLTGTAVEILYKGKRVASHQRLHGKGKYSTIEAHLSPGHQKYLEWTPERIISWAKSTGPATAQLVKNVIASKQVPEQGFRSCLGIIRLGKRYSPQRLEAACAKALSLKAYSYKSVQSILEKGMDLIPTEERSQTPARSHENVRGAAYYRGEGGYLC